MLSEANVSDGAQGDVEGGDDAHAQIQDRGEVSGILHLILEW